MSHVKIAELMIRVYPRHPNQLYSFIVKAQTKPNNSPHKKDKSDSKDILSLGQINSILRVERDEHILKLQNFGDSSKMNKALSQACNEFFP